MSLDSICQTHLERNKTSADITLEYRNSNVSYSMINRLLKRYLILRHNLEYHSFIRQMSELEDSQESEEFNRTLIIVDRAIYGLEFEKNS